MGTVHDSAVRKRSVLVSNQGQTIELLSLWSEHQSQNNLSIIVLSELPRFVYLTPPRAKIIIIKTRYLGNFDDVWNVQVRCNRGQAFPNQVSLIRLLPAKTRTRKDVQLKI